MMSAIPMPALKFCHRRVLCALTAAFALASMTQCLFAQNTPASGIEATAAPLSLPAGIAFDASGNLYIADLNDHIIRKVDLGGIITTVAGTGEQGFLRRWWPGDCSSAGLSRRRRCGCVRQPLYS